MDAEKLKIKFQRKIARTAYTQDEEGDSDDADVPSISKTKGKRKRERGTEGGKKKK